MPKADLSPWLTSPLDMVEDVLENAKERRWESVKKKKTPGMEREEKEEKSEGAEGGRKILPYGPLALVPNQEGSLLYSLVLPGRRCRILPM